MSWIFCAFKRFQSIIEKELDGLLKSLIKQYIKQYCGIVWNVQKKAESKNPQVTKNKLKKRSTFIKRYSM